LNFMRWDEMRWDEKRTPTIPVVCLCLLLSPACCQTHLFQSCILHIDCRANVPILLVQKRKKKNHKNQSIILDASCQRDETWLFFFFSFDTTDYSTVLYCRTVLYSFNPRLEKWTVIEQNKYQNINRCVIRFDSRNSFHLTTSFPLQ
jgi:hypothetical protein